MNLDANEVYVDGLRIDSLDLLPPGVRVTATTDAGGNVLRLQRHEGNGRLVIDLGAASGCSFSMGSGNVIHDTLRVKYIRGDRKSDEGASIEIGHMNHFEGDAMIALCETPGAGVRVGTRNHFGADFAIIGGGVYAASRSVNDVLEADVSSRVGSRNRFGDSVKIVNGGAVGDDSIVDHFSVIRDPRPPESFTLLAGNPAVVVAEDSAFESSSPSHCGARPILTVGITTFERAASAKRALASVTSQHANGSSVELIVVDDGSSSDAFREFWASLDSQSDVIRLRNLAPTGGPSAGRNVVIDAARGEYVLFLDDDDFLSDGAIDNIQRCLDGGGAQRITLRYRKGGRSVFVPPAGVHERADIVDTLWTMQSSSIYRLDDVRKTGSRFPEGVHYGEDSEFTLQFTTRTDDFTALTDRDYVVIGDPLPGEQAHLSQGRGSWEDFLRRILSHLERLGIILDNAILPAYVKDRVATKVLLGRSVYSYELVRRISELHDEVFAGEILRWYSKILQAHVSDVVVQRFAAENGLRPAIEAVLDRNLAGLRAAWEDRSRTSSG